MGSIFLGLGVLLLLYILTFRFNDVYGNLEASYVCAAAPIVGSHLVLHKKINKINNKENKNDD